MRGKVSSQPSMLALVSLESMVPADHPLRRIKVLADGALRNLSPEFDAIYADVGRPSVPPERLVKSMLLMALFSVRSERQFCEQLLYNMLFRWFLDMEMVERPFDATAFTHNRDRLHGLLSSEHFSVDGTMIEAWASMKGLRRSPRGVASRTA